MPIRSAKSAVRLVSIILCPSQMDAASASQERSNMPATCRTCPEYLSGCVMVECARCGKVLCKKNDDPYNGESVGVVCEECYFDLCECGDDAE